MQGLFHTKCGKDISRCKCKPIKKQKPSERIQQLVLEEHKRKSANDRFDAIDIGLNAIVKYLDEEARRE